MESFDRFEPGMIGRVRNGQHHEGAVLVGLPEGLHRYTIRKPVEFAEVAHHLVVAGVVHSHWVAQELLWRRNLSVDRAGVRREEVIGRLGQQSGG